MLRAIKESFLKTGWSLGLYTPPDRVMLDRILRAFAERSDCERVLFVGVKAYNAHLPTFFASKQFTTIDPNPEAARFGGKTHFVDVLENLERHAAAESFDLVVMNGVIGFGLDVLENVERALEQVHRALRAEGDLVLGVNVEIPTHVDLAQVRALERFRRKRFEPLGTDRHVLETPFRERTHTFEFWQKLG